MQNFEVDWRMKSFKLTQDEWTRAYDNAWQHGEKPSVNRVDIDLIASHVPNDVRTILDVGCGDGVLTTELAQRGWHITGLDCSSVATSIAKEKLILSDYHVEYLQGFIDSLPFLDKSFDVVTCCHTLEHVNDLDKAISELKRVCKKMIIVIVPIDLHEHERYSYTYHTQFFTGVEDLENVMKIDKHISFVFRKPGYPGDLGDGCIFYAAELITQT